MKEFASKLRNRSPKKIALLPGKLLLWTMQGRLRSNLRVSREYELLSKSGLFDIVFYQQQYKHLPGADLDPIRHFLTVGVNAGCNPNPLFDSRWYLEQNPDVSKSGTNPLVHFVQSGWKEGRNPHPLFDVDHYVASHKNLLQSGENPLQHYLEAGSSEPHDPHILFNNKQYLENNPDVAVSRANPLAHYLQTGWKEGRDPHPLFNTNFYTNAHPEVVEQGTNPLLDFVTKGCKANRNPNPLFDCAYYLQSYPDVSKSGANPLVHYINSGGPELRRPHALFDPGYYGQQAPKAVDGITNPLAHYFESGVKQGLSPHRLFEVAFYLEQHPALSLNFSDPIQHYFEEGAKLGSDPCELFDSSFYLEQYVQVGRAGKNPLVHYLTEGVKAGCNPNPLFDTAYYLKQYPDVARCGQNPLVHYIEAGAFEGRAPSPFFDSLFYLRSNPKVKEAKINPLAHYLIRGGAEEGRDPSPYFSTSNYVKEHPEVKRLGVNPLVHFLGAGIERHAADRFELVLPSVTREIQLKIKNLANHDATQKPEFPDSSLTVICASHVSPYAPRAGNEYRINRLLHWLTSAGHEVIPIISPLPGEPAASSDVTHLAEEFGSAVLCMRNGTVVCSLNPNDTRVLLSDDGLTVPDYAESLDENKPLDHEALELLNTERVFCHDALVHVVLKLASTRKRCVVIAQYVFMSRFLPLLGPEVLKVIDTHDVFSSKQDKVLAYGVSDSLSLTEAEESDRLARADLILAIQPEEKEALERLTDFRGRVITVGVDFPVPAQSEGSKQHKVLCVGSNNQMNAQGLRDFIRFAWPSIARRVPGAELLVAGKVCSSLRAASPDIKLLGTVEDIADLYRQSKVAINPALAGTGLKIKTLEALSFQRPIVTWPTGIDGLHPDLASLCSVAIDWFDFHRKVTRILSDPEDRWFTVEDVKLIGNQLSTSTAYAELQAELTSFNQPSEVAAAACR